MSDTSLRTADPATDGGADPDLDRARGGDEAAFTRLVQPLRRELHAHCYRMLGSPSQQQTLQQLGDTRLREIVGQYAAALEHGDVDTLVSLLTEDVTWSMPPMPHWYHGRGAVTDFAVQVPLTSCGSWQHLFTTANGQPAVASYLLDDGTGAYRAWSINVLALRRERIGEITSFIGVDHFAPFGLPSSMSVDNLTAG